MAITANEHVIVANMDNHRVIVFDKEGTMIRTFGTQGSGKGQFSQPIGVAVTADSENLLVYRKTVASRNS